MLYFLTRLNNLKQESHADFELLSSSEWRPDIRKLVDTMSLSFTWSCMCEYFPHKYIFLGTLYSVSRDRATF